MEIVRVPKRIDKDDYTFFGMKLFIAVIFSINLMNF